MLRRLHARPLFRPGADPIVDGSNDSGVWGDVVLRLTTRDAADLGDWPREGSVQDRSVWKGVKFVGCLA